MNSTFKVFKLGKVIPTLLMAVFIILLCQSCDSVDSSPTPIYQTQIIEASPSPDHVLTIAAYETQIAGLTLTSEFTPIPSPTSTPTVTPIPPTNVPTPTITPTLQNCNWAEFVRDITIPDGTEIEGGETFSKTWRLRNIGDCPWTIDYDFVFVGGETFNAPSGIGVPTFVGPGEMVDITILMEAPTYPGNYRGYFMLADRQGERFGTGADADERL